jgi:hypothetical protein
MNVVPKLKSSWKGWPWLAAEGLSEAAEAHYVEGKPRRNIGLRQAKLGPVVAQDLVGLLLRSEVERNSMIF